MALVEMNFGDAAGKTSGHGAAWYTYDDTFSPPRVVSVRWENTTPDQTLHIELIRNSDGRTFAFDVPANTPSTSQNLSQTAQNRLEGVLRPDGRIGTFDKSFELR